MEELQNSEKFVNWVRPNLQNERSEIERAVSEFVGIEPTHENVERVIESIGTALISNLSEADWQKLENTDSFENVRPGHIEDVERIIETYNKDLSRGTQRNVSLLVGGFKSGNEMETPVILESESGYLHLVSGNTRLMVARVLNIQPKVIIAKFN
jgi:hypothetical protein